MKFFIEAKRSGGSHADRKKKKNPAKIPGQIMEDLIA